AISPLGLLKIDKIVVAIPWSEDTEKKWQQSWKDLFQAIRTVLGTNVYDHDGYCDTDPWFRRRREFGTEAHLVEIYHSRKPCLEIEGKGLLYNHYQSYIRITCKDFLSGYAEHVQLCMQIEKVLDQFSLPHHLGMGRQCCELCVDFPDHETWKWIDWQLLWAWTRPDEHAYYSEEEMTVVPGFDPLQRSRYVKEKDARRRFHSYIESQTGKFRVEMRLKRAFLRDHEITAVSDLLSKGKELFERHYSLWEASIDKILRQRRKYEKKRQCSAFYRPGERSYRKMVNECSAAQVLLELSARLKDLTPYEIKEKCFRRIPSPRIEWAPFKRDTRASCK